MCNPNPAPACVPTISPPATSRVSPQSKKAADAPLPLCKAGAPLPLYAAVLTIVRLSEKVGLLVPLTGTVVFQNHVATEAFQTLK